MTDTVHLQHYKSTAFLTNSMFHFFTELHWKNASVFISIMLQPFVICEKMTKLQFNVFKSLATIVSPALWY